MRKFISGQGRHVKKECKAALLIYNMDTSRLMVYAQQVEDEKRKDKEEHMSKKARYDLQGQSRQSFRPQGSQSQTSKECPIGGNRAQHSTTAPSARGDQRGTTSGMRGGTNCLYAMDSRQDQENYPNVLTGMI
ncbi:uncharacterized protein LOC129892948 [Solanum dulcamara]|uniref:uncharacterized protein LOC129892948 n=1 Tax=Solanum dulcamara TaxID=45834 RepID=UPI0024860F00|nr:uncharacterized protein LOC129892948 [Solanum dulcamara]